jgi:SAM-dependent methyltransferase
VPTSSPEKGPTAAQRWADALSEWAIPKEILAQAEEPPWPLPSALFAADDKEIRAQAETRATRVARMALTGGGSILDVGCGGGRASLPLSEFARSVTGLDESQEMLANFQAAWGRTPVPHREVLGQWPGAGAELPPSDVVLCHHVVYNVAPIGPFLAALTEHARRLVVVTLPDRHPTSPFNFLWEHFWGLTRPQGPRAELFLEVVGELGIRPQLESELRPPRGGGEISRKEYLAFARRRLCLPQKREAEVDLALGDSWPLEVPLLHTVSWPGRA